MRRKLKVLSLFSGIGAFEKALTNVGIDYELVGFSEIDKYAIESYSAIHNIDKELNLGDVSQISKSEIPNFDLLVGGSPCQAFSVAGNRRGFEDTRGTLVFQYIETLKEKQPKYFVYENVKGLINHDKGQTFDIIVQSFSEVGYRIDLKLLNSKYFIPQNRERIYIVGIREDIIENKDWDIDKKIKNILTSGKLRLTELEVKSFNFTYPEQSIINKNIKDILETEVDEKYYLDEEKTQSLLSQLEGFSSTESVVCEERHDEGIRLFKDNVCGTLRTIAECGDKRVITPVVKEGMVAGYRIRKLTPLECFRLQAFSDEDFYNAKNTGISNSQLYKQAGNSITVSVLEGIFKELYNTYIDTDELYNESKLLENVFYIEENESLQVKLQN